MSLDKVLILTAIPDGLRLDKEIRDIVEAIRRAVKRDKWEIQLRTAVRPQDIRRALAEEQPSIVHFCGHGMEDGSLVLEDDSGNHKAVSPFALAALFKLHASHVKCVLLNACYSEKSAVAISQHINYTIGMNQPISDKGAIVFAIGFYDGLGYENPDSLDVIPRAFEEGLVAIQMEDVSLLQIPVLKIKLEWIENSTHEPEADNLLLGQLIGNVPNLPPHFLPRDEQLNPLKNKVLADINQPVAITGQSRHVGLQGMGGIGKTVLATALARDEEVRRAFPDGVIWITFGQTPQILTLQSDVVEALGDKQASFTEINSGKVQLRKLLTGKTCLLILDDVWNLNDASAFDVLEKPCQMLITTRDIGIITALGGEEYQLSNLSEKQALALLGNWANQAVETLPVTALDVARECGYLPLALSLNGAMVRDGTSWEDLLEALGDADLEFFERPHGSILKSIKISIDALSPNEAQHYLELAVFPEDTAVPEATILQLWTHSNQLSDRNARKLLTTLARKALLRTTGEAPQRKVELHDLQYLYLRGAVSNLSELHTQFLNAYTQKYPSGWHSLDNDGYIFQNLAGHLIQAGRTTELQQLLFDFRWLQAKLDNSNINELIADYNLLPEDANLQLLQRTLLLSGHVLAEDKRQLAGQLLGRLLDFDVPEIQGFLKEVKQWKGKPRLISLTAYLTPPGSSLVRTLTGHAKWVTATAMTPDGRWALSGSEDRTVRLWDLENGQEIINFNGHRSGIYALAITPDGRWGLSGSDDSTLKLWDLANDKTIYTLRGHKDWVRSVAITPDGLIGVSGSWDRSIKLWDLKTGNEIHSFNGHYGDVNGVAITADGQWLLSGSDDNTLKLWNWNNGIGKLVFNIDTHSISALAMTPDGRWGLSGSNDRTLKLWDLKSRKEICVLIGHASEVFGVAITPDRRRAVSSSCGDNAKHIIKLWDLESGNEIGNFEGHTKFVRSVAISSNGNLAVSASDDKSIKLWDLTSNAQSCNITNHTSQINGVEIIPDKQWAISASAEGTLKLWELKSGKEIYTLEGHFHAVTEVAATPDGKKAISASLDQTLILWDLTNRKKTCTLTDHIDQVFAVAMTPDGHWAVSGSADKTLKLWDLFNNILRATLEGHTDEVNGVAITPDGRLALSGSDDRTLKLWDLNNGKEIRTFTGHNDAVMAVAITPDGQWGLSGSQDETLKLWNLESGTEISTLVGHSEIIMSVALTQNARYAISTSYDYTLNVWDLNEKKIIASFSDENVLLACAVAPDGVTIVAGGRTKKMHFLRLEGCEKMG